MELNYLRAFYEVAKAGSFMAAARALHISQSALSKSVALLEDSEGVKLFERSKKGVTLTPVGTLVFQKSEAIFKTVIEIENTCRGIKETCEGPLRIGASDHVANYVLSQKAREMVAAHPDVIPSFLSGTPNEIIAAILNNEIELGLFFTKVPVPQISYEPLFPLTMAIVVHKDLAKTDQKKFDLARLRAVVKETGLIGSIQSQYRHSPSEDLDKIVGKSPKIAFESNSQETQKRFCLAGGGVAFLARFMVEKEIANGTLIELPLEKPVKLNLFLARGNGRALSLSAKTFLGLLRGDED